MTREYVISLKFDGFTGISKIKFGLAVTAVLFCLFPAELGSETLTVTAWYPAPVAAYTSFLTTGRALLARDGSSVGIGTSDLTLAAPNGAAGNLYVNDIYLRARNEWASRIPITTIYTRALGVLNPLPAGLSCQYADETLSGGGCRAGWEFTWAGVTINFPALKIGICPFCITIGPYTFNIGGFSVGLAVACGTVPDSDERTMWFYYPNLQTANIWISCVKNKP